jgi:hypothetical protein
MSEGRNIAYVTTDLLDEADIRQRIASNEAGAISVFVGLSSHYSSIVFCTNIDEHIRLMRDKI